MSRARTTGRSRLEVTITPFEPVSAAVRTSARDEAGHVAAARGATDARMLFGERPAPGYRSSMPG
jgi:hypothetical protein